MRLGELLVGQGLVTQADLDAALVRQRAEGGRLGNTLIAMGVLTADQLLMVLHNQHAIESALYICEQTLKNREAAYGATHPNTNRARYDLACALLAAGRPAESAVLAEVALSGYDLGLGRDHPWTREAAQLVADARLAAAHTDGPACAAPA